MENISYWQKTAEFNSLEAIKENLEVDIVIIGGGITGVMCAYYLKDTGRKIAVFEQGKLGGQTTGHTTAKISYLHKTIYQFLLSNYNIEIAEMYLDSNREAIQDIEEIIQKEGIDCEFQKNNAYVYTKYKENCNTIEKEIDALQKVGIEPLINQHQDPNILKSVGVKGQATFHPLKYLYGIVESCQKAGILFYENSQAINFEKKKLGNSFTCNNYRIDCSHLILATRYPQINFPKEYFLKLQQTREHIMFGEGDTNLADSYISIDNPTESFRSTSDGNIYIGYGHDIGKVKDVKELIYKRSLKHFNSQNPYFWAAQDTKTIRGIPYIGYFNKPEDKIYIACGFNKWGMTLSHVSAKIISDLILHKDNMYQSIYATNYTNLKSSKFFLEKQIKATYKGFIKNRLVLKNKKIDSKKGKVVRIKGKLVGVYVDENNLLHMINPHCRHLKCILEFNELEKTWDCPCHGSRYTIDGKLLEGPATNNLKNTE